MILLEDLENISSVLEDMNTISGEKLFVSLTPSVSYAFERSNIPYKSIRDYHNDECLYQGLENIKRIERITTILDNELGYINKISTLNPAKYSIFNLKLLFDGLWTVILVLKSIIEIEKPDFICLYTSHSIRSDIGRYAFINDESVYAEIMALDGWHIPIEIIQYNRVKNESTRETAETTKIEVILLSFLKKHDFLFNLGLIWKREGAGAVIRSFFYSLRSRPHKPILIYNSGYNWDDSLIEFYRQGMYPIYRITDESFESSCSPFPDYGDEVRRVCTQNPAMREYDSILGIDVSDFFYKRLSQIIGASIAESVASYQSAQKIIQRKKIRCLLVSTRENASGNAVIQAAKDCGIPVISWQHGGGGYAFWPMIPAIEFYNSDVHFVFTEKVAQNYINTAERVGMHQKPAFFPVGSSSLDYIYKQRKKTSHGPSQKKCILYITTHYEKNVFLISHPFDPFGFDEHLWSLQKKIMDLAAAFPKNEFIIKLHSTHTDKEPLKVYKNDHHITNLQILSSEKSLMELTDIADFVIIDHITTGILQILTNDIPVFVYNGLSLADNETIVSLKKRAYVYHDIETLITDLGKYISDRTAFNPKVDITNTDFIINYGTDVELLNSAEKAVKKLKELIIDVSK